MSWQLNKVGNRFQRLSLCPLSSHHVTYVQLWVTLLLSPQRLCHLPSGIAQELTLCGRQHVIKKRLLWGMEIPLPGLLN